MNIESLLTWNEKMAFAVAMRFVSEGRGTIEKAIELAAHTIGASACRRSVMLEVAYETLAEKALRDSELVYVGKVSL